MKRKLTYIIVSILTLLSCSNKKDNFLGKWIVCGNSELIYEITKDGNDYLLSEFPYPKGGFPFRLKSENLLIDETGLNKISFDKTNQQLIYSVSTGALIRFCRENSKTVQDNNLEFNNKDKDNNQSLSFEQMMDYFFNKNEKYILSDLENKKYMIQNEQASQVLLFDTQINCYKLSDDNDPSKLMGIVILKTKSIITALSYFSFNSKDFKNKIEEIINRGFIQTVKNPSSHWVFKKGDTLVTGEKKNIILKNEIYDRYELSIISLEKFKGKQE